MNLVDSLFSHGVHFVKQINPESLFIDLISEGMIASAGAVFVFVPQIFILFLGISALEGTGYLARAVALSDGFLSRFGLSGKIFCPFSFWICLCHPSSLGNKAYFFKKGKAHGIILSSPYVLLSKTSSLYSTFNIFIL